MAVIVERTFSGGFAGTKRGLTLYKEEYIRPLPFGDNWTRLRIVVLMGLGNTSTVTGLVDIGVCSGTQGGIGSGSPINYVGGGLGGGATSRLVTPSLTYNVATGGWPFTDGHRHAHTQYGATTSYARVSSAWVIYGPNSTLNAGVPKRGMVVIELVRLSTTSIVIINGWGDSYDNGGPPGGGDQSYAQCDFGPSSVQEACENAAWFTSSGILERSVRVYNLQASAYQTYLVGVLTAAGVSTRTYSAAAGPLDSVNIAWNLNSVGCTIWDIAVVKFD